MKGWGGNNPWSELLTLARLLEYLTGLPWIPKAGVAASLALLSLLALALMFVGLDRHDRKVAFSKIKSFISAPLGLLLLMLAVPGLALFIVSQQFLRMDFVARYFFVCALGLNLLPAALLGGLWKRGKKTKLHYVLFSLTILFLVLRVWYPLKGHYQMRDLEARFASQVRTLDSLSHHERLLFDVSYLDFRFFWQVCWASPPIERLAIAPVEVGASGPRFMTKYYKNFDSPRLVALAQNSSPYDGSVLVSSNPGRAWKAYYDDVSFEPLLSLGETTGGLGMAAFRILRTREKPPLE